MLEQMIHLDQLYTAIWETVYMSIVALVIGCFIGFWIGIILYCTQSGGLIQNRFINRIVDVIVNVLRAIPYIILLILLKDVAKFFTGSILGASAALPSLIAASSPFFARMTLIGFQEVDKGTIEASKAMGANNFQIITKVLLPESLPSLVSAITVTAISLISYTAMAGAIGAGGLGNLAYLYGYARRNNVVLYTATILIIIFVFGIQWLGDWIVHKIDKR